MDKWVDHVLIYVKIYTYLVIDLAVLLRIYELAIGVGKNGTSFKPNIQIAKSFNL